MTGTVVYLNINGHGEIRTDEFKSRVPFGPGALSKIPLRAALGLVVEFDLMQTAKGLEAVRLRRARGCQ